MATLELHRIEPARLKPGVTPDTLTSGAPATDASHDTTMPPK